MKMPENKTYESNLLIILIILLGLAVRLVYLWQISEYPNFSIPYAGLDAALYHDLAKEVAAGNIILGKEVYYYSPFYAYFLGGFYYLFGESYWTARILNIVLGTATIFLVYLYTLKIFQRRSIALIAAFGAAIYGPFIVFDTSMLKETILRTILSLAILVIAHASEKKEKKRLWFYAGFLLGISMSISGQAGLFVIAICCWLLFKKHAEGVTILPTTETVMYPKVSPPLWAYGSEPTAHRGGDEGEGENSILITPTLTLPPQGGGKDKNTTPSRRLSVSGIKNLITIGSGKFRSLLLRLAMISSFLAGIILVLSPFTIRNYYVSGDMVLTTNTKRSALFYRKS